MSALTEQARAKVNLTLRVVGRRVDGYHDLESVVAFANCADTLTLEVGDELSLTTTGPGASDCGDSTENLVLKAARLLAARVENLRTGHFRLEKHLPVAAGIGGGSADAAAALRLLARANVIGPDDPRLLEVAKLTGADVPVCLESTSCVMTGVGDTLLPLPLPAMSCVLVNPRVAVATKDVFAQLGLKAGRLRVGVADVLKGMTWPQSDASREEWLRLLEKGTNDLEAPALAIQPVIADVLAALRAADGVLLARMSGSGATCFALFADQPAAQAAAADLAQARPGWWVHAGLLG
ncbi:MAG: 4-diphosphocytidyl-2-C-methyl-D-erythritol kinase [Tardiphaga sp.]|nr:4-diphosphocytidyl-2-C-methyl-D-erythritol kinase [Tardiphaga sp.]MDB5631017.1 4-diphosphocytidyl-2-C-methyl-D-erythritol kinase [Tardiphaga sp.]